MRYTYAYKSSDGIRHEASMSAASREEVFETLRKRGVKAIKVVAADGSKANGEVRGVRKRVVAAVAICAAVVAGVISFYVSDDVLTSARLQSNTATPRHQIYGDPVVMEGLERGKFESFLPRPGDRFLAWYAQPGKVMCPKSTTQDQLWRMPDEIAADLKRTLDDDVVIEVSDLREVRELKQIVNGMRQELREYLANGNGTIRSYGRRLLERTQQEIQIYERTRKELEKEVRSDVWKTKNDALRTLGLRTIPNPHDE